MQKFRPFPYYLYSKDKSVCKVCKTKLRPLPYWDRANGKPEPRGYFTALQLRNRALCSIDCLYKAYDDYEATIDLFNEHVDYLEVERGD